MTSAALPTFLEMQTSVYAVLRDSEQAFITLAEVKGFLNEGLLDLNARLRLKQTAATGTTSSTGTITLPDDFYESISLWIGSTPVQFVTDGVFESYSMPASVTPAAQLGRIFDNAVETYPVQASEDYTWRYVERPTELSDDSDLPTDLTPELCRRVVDYARAEAKLKEGELNEYQIYRSRYEDGLPGPPRADYRMKPVSLNLIPEPGPFGG